MKKISNKFSIIGTNPHKYIENYQLGFDNIGSQEILILDHKNWTIWHNEVKIMEFNSETTFRQNIDCWVGFGLFIKKHNKLIKIYDSMSEDDFYEFLKSIIFVYSNIEKINTYRNTILIKLMYLLNLETIQKFSLQSHTKQIDLEDIKKEIGKFEEKIFEDKELQKIVKIIWGEENE